MKRFLVLADRNVSAELLTRAILKEHPDSEVVVTEAPEERAHPVLTVGHVDHGDRFLSIITALDVGHIRDLLPVVVQRHEPPILEAAKFDSRLLAELNAMAEPPTMGKPNRADRRGDAAEARRRERRAARARRRL